MTEPKGLLATTDAMIWAGEFCRIFDGFQIIPGEREYIDAQVVNEGTMVGWFAAAIELGRNAGRKETCPHTVMIDLDGLEVCRVCGGTVEVEQ